MKYRVVRVSTTEEFEDNKEFPHLLQHVEDEEATFIVAEDGAFYPAEEFFHMVSFKEFTA